MSGSDTDQCVQFECIYCLLDGVDKSRLSQGARKCQKLGMSADQLQPSTMVHQPGEVVSIVERATQNLATQSRIITLRAPSSSSRHVKTEDLLDMFKNKD